VRFRETIYFGSGDDADIHYPATSPDAVSVGDTTPFT
jgi:hypothetical protein